MKSKVIFEGNIFSFPSSFTGRVVRTKKGTICFEHRDGNDSMGIERWSPLKDGDAKYCLLLVAFKQLLKDRKVKIL